MISHRPLNPETDWCFFVPDHPLPADCLTQIRPLAEESARELWRDFISPNARHPMLLPDDAWPSHLIPSSGFAQWQDDWNDDRATTFEAWLRITLPWSQDTSVIFTWSSSQSVESTWEVFTRCWRSFLFDDEGPFLWSLQEPEAIGFTPRGFAHVGRRLSSSTAA
jgi:hypothetical protein